MIGGSPAAWFASMIRLAPTLLAVLAVAVSAPLRAAPDDFVGAAAARHGALGERAARFLVRHMPAADRESLSTGFLLENLALALAAREEFPWAREVPEALFLNDVLPYAVFDEPRDAWRGDFLRWARPIVDGAASAAEAAQRLNRDFFNAIGVHYDTGRKRPNQSPRESIGQGRATCTGLSIILVDACRAVGIPARAVGTAMWTSGRGNHTWVEVWDGRWHFTGADEHDPAGLDRGWFVADAARARADDPRHAIFATSWKGPGVFQLPWSRNGVAAVNVTSRYAKSGPPRRETGVRLWDGEERVASAGRLIAESGDAVIDFATRAGRTDLNDMPRLSLTPGMCYQLQFRRGNDWWSTEPFVAREELATIDVKLADLRPPGAGEGSGLTREQAEACVDAIYQELVEQQGAEREAELEAGEIRLGGRVMKWQARVFGDEPDDGRSLYLSMHGGGGAPGEVNDQQWRNQLGLYQPEEGIYLAPRAPTDTWNLWHEAHIDPMFQRLIENHVALRGVNPDKVYLMGYSAGGDGVWQLAPRMADRFAAAAMMAGHPNEARLDGLRNLPFALFMGAEDAAYDRNRVARERAARLGTLRREDPEGYEHLARIYPGLGHWMDRRDAEALPWMAKFRRQPWPSRIVWLQDDVTHRRFYWLELAADAMASVKAGDRITAEVDGQRIRVAGKVPPGTRLLLRDALIDLDQPVVVELNGELRPATRPVRSEEVIRRALEDRLDPAATPTAVIVLD